MKHNYFHYIIAITFFCLLTHSSCVSKSRISLNDFSKLDSIPQFNGTYLNLKSDLGYKLHLRDPNDSLIWWGSLSTDLINIEYTERDSLRISFWTESGLEEKSYKAKKVKNCIEVILERKRLWIPALFHNSIYRLRFGSDADNNLLLHVKDDQFGWFLIFVGGYGYDEPYTYNKLQTMCKDTTMLIPQHIGDKWGYQDCTGKTIIEPIYDFVRLFDSHGLARVKKGSLWGMIDLDENVVVPYKYTKIMPYDNKINGYQVYINDDFGYIRASGEEFIPTQYRPSSIYSSYDFPSSVMRNGKYGFIDSTGVMCPAILDKIDMYGWRIPDTTDPAYGRLMKVKYKDQKYYLSLDGYLYSYDHKFFKFKTTLFDDQRIKVTDIEE